MSFIPFILQFVDYKVAILKKNLYLVFVSFGYLPFLFFFSFFFSFNSSGEYEYCVI